MTDEQTPTGRLHALLAEMAIEGMDAPTIRDLLTPSIPLGDAEFWMRSGLDKEVRRYLREAGLVLNHHDVDDDAPGVPAGTWVQFSIPEVVTHIQHVQKQMAEDDAALERRLDVWCEANQSADMTPEKLRGLARDAA